MVGYLNMDSVKGIEKKEDWYQRLLETMNEGFSIMDKLDLHSIADLTKYALREGLTSLFFFLIIQRMEICEKAWPWLSAFGAFTDLFGGRN
jgi:hypothetical protein